MSGRKGFGVFRKWCRRCLVQLNFDSSANWFTFLMTLYHASRNKFEPGDILDEAKRTPSEETQWVDQLFDDRKPDDLPSRQSARFAFRELPFCAIFLEARNQGGDIFYYEVEVDTAHAAPVVLVDCAQRHGNENVPELLVEEYWDPQKDWHCYEYLAKEMKIIDVVEGPNQVLKAGAKHKLQMDRDKAKGIDWSKSRDNSSA